MSSKAVHRHAHNNSDMNVRHVCRLCKALRDVQASWDEAVESHPAQGVGDLDMMKLSHGLVFCHDQVVPMLALAAWCICMHMAHGNVCVHV
jgi:hypothetical protein